MEHTTSGSRMSPIPRILNPRDAIVKVTSTAICGSDLHLYDGYIPTMQPGDILGHEFMGEVVDVGPATRASSVGDRVVVPFTIACGSCFFCKKRALVALRQLEPERLDGREALRLLRLGALRLLPHATAAMPAARPSTCACRSPTSGRSRCPRRCPTSRCCSSPTSFRPATWRPRTATSSPATPWRCGAAGPVGQFAIQSACLLGAERVIAIDRVPERLRMAATRGKAETIDYEETGLSSRR